MITKEIIGFEGKYTINENGEIWSVKNNKYLKHNNTHGYRQVNLAGKILSVHRLLAQTFIPNLLNLPEVNHKNGIRYDNRLENLEWCSHKQNINHAEIVLQRPFGRNVAIKLDNKTKRLVQKLRVKKHTLEYISNYIGIGIGAFRRIFPELRRHDSRLGMHYNSRLK